MKTARLKMILKFLMTLILLVLLFSVPTYLLATDQQEVLIQSLESRTSQNEAVYNKIKYIRQNDREIWMMNQSHAGLVADETKWERLAIIIQNNQVSFYQIEAGPLEWSDELLKKQVPYRATCFACHNNGPRAIRPDQEGVKLSFIDQTRIFFWNIRIKLYGHLSESSEMKMLDPSRQVPFKHRNEFDLQTLEAETCLKCHNENKRGRLTRQQSGTIEFMVKRGFMPPFGSLNEKELKAINRFVRGH